MTLRQHYLHAARANVLYELAALRIQHLYLVLASRARSHRGYKTWQKCFKRAEVVHLERLRKAIVLRCEARDRMYFDPQAAAREIAQRFEFMRRAS